MKILRGASKSSRHPKGGGALKKLGGAPKIFILQNQQEGGLLINGTASERGAAKISSFKFQYLHPPPCHIKKFGVV